MMRFVFRVFCVVVVIALSVIVASFINLISINETGYIDEESFATRGLKNEPNISEKMNLHQHLTIGDSEDHLLWFLQVSDIHISVFHDLTRVSDLREFCTTTLDVIKPDVVLASGDLTDAKSADNMGSRQYVAEWEYYKDVLEECKVEEKTLWLDVKGNHDTFNVPGQESSQNFFRNYSIQGAKHIRSYMVQVPRKDETYSFIAVDASLEPGPRRPFNFIGVLGTQEFEQLKKFEQQARENGNFTIWFGHYPTSCILTPDPGLRDIIGRSGLAYMCGHLHKVGGLVPNMYVMQKTGYLELELADWKDNRMYRLGAIDHGLFNFIDIPHGEWPVILVTNPKHALYIMPGREPIHRIHNSTHIRVLVFSPAPIIRVMMRIDQGEWQTCNQVSGPLYVVPWNATLYTSDSHTIEVVAEDAEKRIKSLSQPFSLDGTRPSFNIFPRITLMTNASAIFQCMFGSMLLMCIVPLCIFRILHCLVKRGVLHKPKKCQVSYVRKMWILATIDRMFFPLTFYSLYLTVGPWFIGEVLENHTGAIFAWGTIIHGSYLPGSLTYFYGFLQMLTFQFPLILFLAHCVDRRFQTLYCEDACSMLRYIVRHIPFICIVALQMAFAYFFWLAYGTMAFVLGPLRTWSIVIGIILWWQAVTLPESCLREANLVWTSRSAKVSAVRTRAILQYKESVIATNM